MDEREELAHLMMLAELRLDQRDHAIARLAATEAENVRLRASLAQSSGACVYCSLSKEEWAKCQHGFPGCARADDAMGCPELGASMQLATVEAALAEAKEALLALKDCSRAIVGASMDDDAALEAFEMYWTAMTKARAALASIEDAGNG